MSDVETYKPAKFFKSKYSMSNQTLRNWADAGYIRHLQFNGKNGKCVYLESDVARHLGHTIESKPKLRILYARVSSTKQKEDLGRQRSDLITAYPKHDRVITDIGSGVNFNRKGLQTLLELVYEGMVEEVVVMHRDRLTRIGQELLDGIFKKFGVRLVVHCQSEDNEEGKSDELMSIITLFVASHHGKRAAANKRRRVEEESTTREIKRKGVATDSGT
jgi:predicted site-specific integrase-resolvase